MEVAREVAHVAQDKRKHTEVTVYREAGSGVYYYRVQIGGRRFKRSTGKTNYKEAVAQAKVIRRELQGDGQARSTMKRPGYATLGEVLAVWEFNGKTAAWGVGSTFSLSAAGLPETTVAIEFAAS